MDRHPEAIIKSFEMDPQRRTLFVEGAKDRLLLEWLVGNNLDENTQIREIDFVHIKSNTGGKKGRIIKFAQLIENKVINIYFFADADFDRILKVKLPSNIILTDNNDMEGYILSEQGIKKLLKVGLSSEKITPNNLLNSIFSVGRKIGILRITSYSKNLKLPFKIVNENFNRYILIDNQYNVKFKDEKYIRALLQASQNLTLRDFNRINDLYLKNISKFKTTESLKLTNGKDALLILQNVVKKLGIDKKNIDKVLWMYFNRELISNHNNLFSIVNILENN